MYVKHGLADASVPYVEPDHGHAHLSRDGWRAVVRACQAAGRTAGAGFGPRSTARAAAVELATAPAEARIGVAAVLAARSAKLAIRVDLAAYWRELAAIGSLGAELRRAPPRRRPAACFDRARRERLPVEVARAVPITVVLERYGFRLRRCGRDFETSCPFCGDRSRSRNLRVYPRDRAGAGRYHCFACEATGDAIAFVMALRDSTIQQLNNSTIRRQQFAAISEHTSRARDSRP
jgi:hypothetical protein